MGRGMRIYWMRTAKRLGFRVVGGYCKSDAKEQFVKALLHATGVLCVYGSGFGLPPEQGFLRIVFLAPLDELNEIYDLMAAFTAQYLQR